MLNKYNKGFTLIEIMIVIIVIVIIIAITLPSLSQFKRQQSLKNNSEEVLAMLNKARSHTISSLNSNNYGIHFDANKIVLFLGTSYNSSNSTNEEFDFDSVVTIPSGGINILGGNNVVFERISGNTSNYGTIILQLSSDPASQKTITINKIGVISIN